MILFLSHIDEKDIFLFTVYIVVKLFVVHSFYVYENALNMQILFMEIVYVVPALSVAAAIYLINLII